MRCYLKWNFIRKLLSAVLCAIAFTCCLYMLESTGDQREETCGPSRLGPPDADQGKAAWTSASSTGLEVVNYSSAWQELDLQSLKCINVDNSSLSEGEAAASSFKFHIICPNAEFSSSYTKEVAFVRNIEKNAFHFVQQYAESHPDTILLDIGANIGALSIPLANAVPTVRVVALEPVTENVRLLTKAIILNRVQDRFLLLKHAIYDRANLALSMISYNNVLSWARIDDPIVYKPPDREKDKVENQVVTVTFDELAPLVRGYSRCVIKIDVEGAECIAVRKIENFLSSIHVPMIVMETDKVANSDHECVSAAFKLLEKRGYKPHNDEGGYPFRSLDTANFRRWKHINTVWIKRCDGKIL